MYVSPSDPDKNTLSCKIRDVFTLHCFIMEPINILSFLPCGVMFHHKHSFALNNVAHTTFLRIIILGKPTQRLQGQNLSFYVWPLRKAGVMGRWRRPTKTIYLSNSVYFTILIKLHRTWHAGREPTPTVAWENASLS